MDKEIILIIEPDERQNDIYRRTLGDSYNLHFTPTQEAAIYWLQKNKADLIILDVNMPDGSGISFRDYMHNSVNADFLFVSSSDDFVDKYRALNLTTGRTGYITKSDPPDKLIEYVGFMLQRKRDGNAGTDYTLFEPFSRFGPLIYETYGDGVYLSFKELPLTEEEKNALLFMARRAGKWLTFDWLYEVVWRRPHYNQEDYAEFIKPKTAQAQMDALMEKVNMMGKTDKNAEIKYEPEKGYMLWLKGYKPYVEVDGSTETRTNIEVKSSCGRYF